MPHLLPVTSLRFFAALAIFVFHLQGTLGFGSPYAPLANGVSFFFVLSGFILAYTQRGAPRPGWKRDFYLKRVARVWPLHLATWAFALIAFNRGMVSDWNWWPFALTNAFLFQAWIPQGAYVFAFNGVSWSLSAELFFYLLIPFLLHFRGLGRLACALAALPVIAALAFDLSGYLPKTVDAWQFSSSTLLLHNPLLRLAEFCLGVWVGIRFRSDRTFRLLPGSATVREVTAVALVVVFAISSLPFKSTLSSLGLPHLGIWYHQSAGMIFFALLIVVFAQGEGRISRLLSVPWLVRLGEASFALYMVHLMVMVWAAQNDWIGRFGWGSAVLAVTLVSFVGAIALWQGVELPARRFLLGRREQHSLPVPLPPERYAS